MFEKIRERIEERQRVKGLSRAMSIVDEYMCPGLTPRALDMAYGQAYAEIRRVYIKGEITWNETQAALVTLNNQHDKLYQKAVMEFISE